MILLLTSLLSKPLRIIILRLIRYLVQGKSQNLEHKHNNHLHQHTHGEINPHIGINTSKYAQARIHHAHDNKRQRRNNTQQDAVFALGHETLVRKGNKGLDAEQYDNSNHETNADAAGGRVVDFDGAVFNVERGRCAADDGDDDGDQDEKLDEALVGGF